ncbi:MAG: right-handed parallel beta-helix repeat-containing protein [Phycisphaerae bacterium]|nr:right-handed parallel beta-helix repeat-containing protein [Phycisphaerae bacterium]
MSQRGFVFLGVAFATTAVLAVSSGHAQTTWYVDDDNCPGPGSGTPSDPFCTIQAGIDAASDGDEVVVLDGHYTGAGNRDLDFSNGLAEGETRAITVRSENGPYDCIIDCEGGGRGFHFHSGETAASVVEGLTIQNGSATSSSPGCDSGGGILCDASSPVITGCTFMGNSATAGGGGMYNLSGGPTIMGCRFTGNSAPCGGGMRNVDESTPTVADCTFNENSGANGGGMYNFASSPTVIGCTFSGNSAVKGLGGGGMLNASSNPTVTNCTFSANSETDCLGGGGMFNWVSSPVVTNCTFTGNVACCGGGIYGLADSSPTVTNCILYGNTAGEVHGDSPIITYTDVRGGWPGAGNINADPLFAYPEGGDGGRDGWEGVGYHLRAGSPCVNTGSNYAPDLLDEDITGNPRIQHCRVDMGAYESPHVPVTSVDCNGNGQEDNCDVFTGLSQDCNQNHVPDECEAWCDFDGDAVVDGNDYAIFLSAFGSESYDEAFVRCADHDDDGTVTLVDYQYWLACYRDYVGDPGAPPPGMPLDSKAPPDGQNSTAHFKVLRGG